MKGQTLTASVFAPPVCAVATTVVGVLAVSDFTTTSIEVAHPADASARILINPFCAAKYVPPK